MSFSSDIKNEVTRLESTKEELISELSAIVRNSAIIEESLKIYVENNSVARRIFKIIKNVYAVTPVVTVRKKVFNNGLSYIIDVKNKNKLILDDISIVKNGNYLNIPMDYIVGDEELIRSYLRGLFLVCGSVNDPKTSRYHLEILVNDYEYAKYISKKINEFDLNSKIIKRDKKIMVYIKEAEKISDFLRVIKAYNAVMYFEDIRIYRDHKNMTNRLNNCEQANMDKIFYTANAQIKDIEKLYEYGLIDIIDEKLKIAVEYRIKYPEYSLVELSNIISKETGKIITKSGLNHRYRKIKEIVSKYEENKK